MTDAVANPRELQDLYRFALILSNDPAIAEDTLDQCLQEVFKNHASDPHRAFITFILNLRKRIFQKVKPAQSEEEAEEPAPLTGNLPDTAASVAIENSAGQLLAALHRLGEPERSAYALWHLDLLDSHDLAKLLGLTEEDLSLRLQSARLKLAASLSAPPAQTV
jgi:DNA-directed RNA polymerase specialized sigma24 family protein